VPSFGSRFAILLCCSDRNTKVCLSRSCLPRMRRHVVAQAYKQSLTPLLGACVAICSELYVQSWYLGGISARYQHSVQMMREKSQKMRGGSPNSLSTLRLMAEPFLLRGDGKTSPERLTFFPEGRS
jgi:hypothetical protein